MAPLDPNVAAETQVTLAVTLKQLLGWVITPVAAITTIVFTDRRRINARLTTCDEGIDRLEVEQARVREAILRTDRRLDNIERGQEQIVAILLNKGGKLWITQKLIDLGLTRDSLVWFWSRLVAGAALIASGIVPLDEYVGGRAAFWLRALAVVLMWFGGTYGASPLPGAKRD